MLTHPMNNMEIINPNNIIDQGSFLYILELIVIWGEN